MTTAPKIGFLGLTVVVSLLSAVYPFAAFEAKVVNVTAKIENRPATCEAKSLEDWRDYQGCDHGSGSSPWTAEINALSVSFSGAFFGLDGSEICRALDLETCDPRNSFAGNRCRARAHTLANELNLLTSRLRPDALLAGADNGQAAFDRLGISANWRIDETVRLLETILTVASTTEQSLADAAYVAKRLHNFYTWENPNRPECVLILPPTVELPPLVEPATVHDSLLDPLPLSEATTSAEIEEGEEELNSPELDNPVATTTDLTISDVAPDNSAADSVAAPIDNVEGKNLPESESATSSPAAPETTGETTPLNETTEEPEPSIEPEEPNTESSDSEIEIQTEEVAVENIEPMLDEAAATE